MKFSDLKLTGARLEHGAWVSNLPNLPGVSVKVRGAFNADYNALFSKLALEHDAETFKTDEVQFAIDTELLLETILLDWDGFEDFPYSKENARTALTDPDTRIFRRAVNWAANNVAARGRESVEEAAKNL